MPKHKQNPAAEAPHEAPFYPDTPVLVVSQAQFDHAWQQLSAQRRKPQSERARKAAEAVMVKQLSYKRAAALLNEPQAYIRTAHLWNLGRLRPFLGGMGLLTGEDAPPLVLQGVPVELHAGIRERVEKMVAQYVSAQYLAARGEPAAPTEATATQPAGTPAEET